MSRPHPQRRRTRPIAIASSEYFRGHDPFGHTRWGWSIFWLGLALIMLAAAVAGGQAPDVSGGKLPPDHAQRMTRGLELFKSEVAGLLDAHCVKCHGGKKTEAGFDLTSREGLLKGGDAGPAVVPFRAKESLLAKLIAHRDEPAMPYEQEKLSETAIAKITSWIDDGAPYEKALIEKAVAPKGRSVVTDEDRKFWSFQPLHPSTPPAVKNDAWCRTPIDRFVLAGLQAKGIVPNSITDRRQLIRRASFDLIGLPPTPAEVETFVSDPSPNAYEKLIDRLLLSPHYGERWGRHWLDLARFAESHGYEQDYDRPSAYHFRDFVIRALNEDVPYDRFVKLQIAGDELEPDNPQALMATGFLGAGTHATQITANQVEKERYDELDDMAATIGTSMLGMTIGCARCHDHKFDPIPQQDYYRMLSTFTTTVRSEIELNLHPEKFAEAKAAFDREHAPIAAPLAKFERGELPGRLETWLKADPQPPQPTWLVLDLDTAKAQGGATLTRQDDGSYLATGPAPASDIYTLIARSPEQGITAVRIEALADPSLPKRGPGRAKNGNFALSDFRISIAPISGPGAGMDVTLVEPQATFEQKGLPVSAAVDGDKKSAWAVDGQIGKDQTAAFEFESPVSYEKGAVLTFTLKFENNASHSIGRVRMSISTRPIPVALDGESGSAKLISGIAKILQTRAAERTAADNSALMAWFRTTDPEWQKLNAAVAEHLKKAPKPALTKVMVTSEGLPAIRLHTQGADFFEKTYFLKRGDLNQKTGEATQSFLQVLMRTPEEEKRWQVRPPTGWRTSYRRASLANWITDVEHGAGPLLARVIVNRLWQHHLGRGLVGTPSDFGAQGEKPTHPELLEYLAQQLVSQGWGLKAMHKAIMTSAAYMEDNRFSASSAALDPDNILLWRHEPQRMEAEVIRDSMLAVSGLLDETMFGPGTLDEAHKRRSIYFMVKRSKLIPMMALFDAPDSLQGLGQRSSTTIAPQALMLMNNPQVSAYAHALARRLISLSGDSPADAIREGYLIALGRQPSDLEASDTLAFLDSQATSYREAGKPNALELALADFCRTLMSLNEFMYVE